MSQRRQKKELSIMDNVSSLSDQELRAAFRKYDISPGPITDSTRNIYRNKLASLIEEEDTGHSNFNSTSSKRDNNADIEEEDEEDSSDEDFELQEEELEEEDEEYDDEDYEEEEEDLMSELQDEDATLSRINYSGFADNTNQTDDPEASTAWVSRGLVVFITALFAVIIGVYLVSYSNSQMLESLKPITRWLLLTAVLSPFFYIAYRTYRYYKNRRLEENQKVCHLVSEAMALLQSPDNPKGMMPILHIRDTLLTPAERKTKQMNVLWHKAVKFVEEHESRVKVELVNIDGEDFRAWKWIGSRKL